MDSLLKRAVPVMVIEAVQKVLREKGAVPSDRRFAYTIARAALDALKQYKEAPRPRRVVVPRD